MTHKILLIDDEPGVYHALKNRAAGHEIELIYSDNQKSGLELLQSDDRIMAVILDGAGLLNPDQEKGDEKLSFVHSSLRELRVLEDKKKTYYPKVVYTAYYEKLQEQLDDDLPIFDKKKVGQQPELLDEMFNYLIEKIESSEVFGLRQHYGEFFELFNTHFSSEVRQLFQKIITDHKHKRLSFNEVRTLLENIYHKLNGQETGLIPDNLFHADGRPNMTYILRYLRGLNVTQKDGKELYPKTNKKLIPDHVLYCMEYVTNICNAFSHDYTYTTYTHQSSAVFEAILEILLWVKEELRKND